MLDPRPVRFLTSAFADHADARPARSGSPPGFEIRDSILPLRDAVTKFLYPVCDIAHVLLMSVLALLVRERLES